MNEFKLAIPSELRRIMQKRKDVDWDSIARDAIWTYAAKIELLDRMLRKSKLTRKDSIEIGRKVNHGLAARYSKVV